jgi:hypothetical protein
MAVHHIGSLLNPLELWSDPFPPPARGFSIRIIMFGGRILIETLLAGKAV